MNRNIVFQSVDIKWNGAVIFIKNILFIYVFFDILYTQEMSRKISLVSQKIILKEILNLF